MRSSGPAAPQRRDFQADQFLELADIAPEFTRRQTEPRVRPTTARQTPAEPFPDAPEPV